MISFDSLTLKAFYEEQKDFLTGSRINKIQQPTRKEVILTLRNQGQTKQLYINIDPKIYHICLASKENIEKRPVEIPQKPPMFCMLLRKYISNAKITKISRPENERILELYIETFNELGDKIYLCLAIELMGKHSNIILYNCDTGIIIGCAHNVGEEKSRHREVYGSIPYIYPPKQTKSNIENYNGEINFDRLAAEFYDFSEAFARQCRGKSLQELKNFVKLKNISPAIAKDNSEYCLFSNLLEHAQPANDVNSMIDDYYTYHTQKIKFNTLKSQYLSIINQKIKKQTKTVELMKNQIEQYKDYRKYKHFADLIMANLYNNEDYKPSITLYDWENNEQISINLNKTLTLKDNANKFYKLYNKSKTANIKLAELVEDAQSKKDYYERILYSINISQDIFDLRDIADEIQPPQGQKSRRPQPSEPIKIKPDEQTTIYIGKNNKQNDYIVSKLSSDNDLWFHTKDCPGSHVLLKTPDPTDELILECAKFAKEYSSAKNSTKTAIICTKRKYLKKPPKSNPGYVTYKNEKEIIVE